MPRSANCCGDGAVVRRALEHQVLEQVRHAGLAVVFVARADQVGDVDGDGRFRGVREQQHLQAVRQAVFGDAFDRRAQRDAFGQGQRGGAAGDQERHGARSRRAQARSLQLFRFMRSRGKWNGAAAASSADGSSTAALTRCLSRPGCAQGQTPAQWRARFSCDCWCGAMRASSLISSARKPSRSSALTMPVRPPCAFTTGTRRMPRRRMRSMVS